MLEKVISGGQTGVDRIGLEVAKELGIATGGTAPLLYMTENGPDESLKDFGLVQSKSRGYPPRTWQNVNDSDGTVLFGDMSSAGSKQTIDYCIRAKKPYIVNPSPGQLVIFVQDNRIKILNVAGNRASKMEEAYALLVRSMLQASFIAILNQLVTPKNDLYA